MRYKTRRRQMSATLGSRALPRASRRLLVTVSPFLTHMGTSTPEADLSLIPASPGCRPRFFQESLSHERYSLTCSIQGRGWCGIMPRVTPTMSNRFRRQGAAKWELSTQSHSTSYPRRAISLRINVKYVPTPAPGRIGQLRSPGTFSMHQNRGAEWAIAPMTAGKQSRSAAMPNRLP